MVRRTTLIGEQRAPVMGAVAWLVLAAGWLVGVVDLSVIRLLLTLAPLVVVPLALDLVVWSDPRAEAVRRLARRAMLQGAIAAVAALLLPHGAGAGVLALLWLGVCGTVALSGLLEAISGTQLSIAMFVRVAATAYLGFGAGWLVLSRLDLRPLDFSPAIVELTAVHFHFTGFAAVIIAATTTTRSRRREETRFATAGVIGIVAAMPLIAIGITASQSIASIGSSLLGLSMVSLVVANISIIRGDGLQPVRRGLLAVSSTAILAGMALAIQWALGLQFGTPALSIDQMAKTHGALNSLGFVLCGLLAWHAGTFGEERRA